MYDHILVGYDSRERARDALALGALLVEPPATLRATYIYEKQPRWYGQEHGHQREHRDELERIRARLASDAEALNYSAAIDISYVGSSSAARGLHEQAEGERVDLVVIGSTHRGPLGRVLIGGVGEILVTGASCAIAVAPSGFARTPQRRLGTVGCGYDGSPESQSALRTAHSLARRKGATMRAIGVVEWRDGLRDRLREDVEALDDSVEVEEGILRGDPARQLAGAASEMDLLVVGSRGYGPLRRALVGGVSNRLMRASPAPVLIVPRAASP